MPYRRRTYKKSTQYKGATRGAIYGAAGYQLYKDVKKLKSLINTEFKFRDTSQTGANIVNTGQFNLLNGIAQGDSGQNRDGLQVRVKSLEWNIFPRMDVVTPQDCFFRAIIFIDTQPNQTQPLLGELLENGGLPHMSPRNLDNRKRFVILKDIKTALQAGQGADLKAMDGYRKLDMKTIYDAAGATIGDITTNSLYVLFTTNVGANGPLLDYYFRIRYIDN